MSEERDYDAEASKEGWAPKDQWKGDPERWKTSQQFVEDGEKIVPILKSKVDRLDQRVGQLLNSNRQLNESTQRSIEKERKENARLIAELGVVRKQAITDSDGDAFDNADRQIQTLRETQEQPVAQVTDWDQRSVQFVKDNPWYNTNSKLATFANGLQGPVEADGFSGQSFFDEVARRTKEAFPEDFGNKNRSNANSVESGGTVTPPSGGQTFNDLPPDAKAAFKDFERDIPGYTKEQYLTDYEWEQVDV